MSEQSIRGRILEFLASHPGEHTSGEITAACKIPPGKVLSALAQMHLANLMLRTGEPMAFRYSAHLSYPKMPRPVGHLGVRLVPTLGTLFRPQEAMAA